jgi:hypothetical protein
MCGMAVGYAYPVTEGQAKLREYGFDATVIPQEK